MASAVPKTQCITCGKDKVTYDCKGCQQSFCLSHLTDHNRQLGEQLEDLENRRNLLKQTLNQHLPSEHLGIQQINQWEQNSIRLIQQTAQEARDHLDKLMTGCIPGMHTQIDKLTDEIKELRKENDFNEIHLNQLKMELDGIQEQLNQQGKVEMKEDSVLIKKINISCSLPKQIDRRIKTKWNPNAFTIVGRKGSGQESNQLSSPCGIAIDKDQTIYIADSGNNRIVKWMKDALTGEVVVGEHGERGQNIQLRNPVSFIIDRRKTSLKNIGGKPVFIIADRGNRRVIRCPRFVGQESDTILSNIDCWGLAMGADGSLYVLDSEAGEVGRWRIETGKAQGTLVAGGYGRGDRLNQFNQPRRIFVDDSESIYVSDTGNHRVMKWRKGAREGVIVAGGNGTGNGLAQLSSPSGIFIDQFETVYVVDRENHRVVRWFKGSKEGEVVVGGNGRRLQLNQLSCLDDLVFDEENNLYVSNTRDHRIQKFSIVENK